MPPPTPSYSEACRYPGSVAVRGDLQQHLPLASDDLLVDGPRRASAVGGDSGV